MSTASRPRLMTAEEFMDADLGDGRFELVRGEVVRVSPPFYPHAAACANLTVLLGNYGFRTDHGRAVGEAAVRTRRGPDSVRGPDVMYFSFARWPREARRSTPGSPVKLPPVAPDVVVEVVSPNDRRSEVQAKVEEYLSAGALAVWVVRPEERTVAIHRAGAAPTMLAEGDAIDDQPELPGFRCMVAEIFED